MYRSRLRRHYYSDLPDQQEEQIVRRRKLDDKYAQGKVVEPKRQKPQPLMFLSRTRPSWEFQARNYRRTRAQVRHQSHQHPLGPFEVEKEDGIICCGCELGLEGSAYGCLWCNFFLHKSCFELQGELNHSLHPGHTLKLLPPPTYKQTPTGTFTCNACGDYGGGFVYHCSSCNFYLHVDCAKLPPSKNNPQLTLFDSPANAGAAADLRCRTCNAPFDQKQWIYYCKEGSPYGVHVDCPLN